MCEPKTRIALLRGEVQACERAVTAPEAWLRARLFEAKDVQIQAATAEANGEVYIRRAKRWIDNPATGERVLMEPPAGLRPLVVERRGWKGAVGNPLRNRRLEVQPEKATVDVGDIADLVPMLMLVRDAVTAGDLDKVAMAAKDDRSANGHAAARNLCHG